MAIHEQTITSLGELIDAVTPEAPDPESGRRRDRGLSRLLGGGVYALLGRDSLLRRLAEPAGPRPHLTKFVIPAEAVPHVRDQFDLAGLDERCLFPDLDGVAAAIRRYYA